MEYILAIGLTLAMSWSIIELNRYKVLKTLSNVRYSQSDIHQRILDIVPKKTNNKMQIESQSAKHAASTMIKIIVIENKAYWVKDNIFYFADTSNGDIVDVTAKPVDISSMSKQDMDKMLFILDNLRKGKKDDSSSTGNK
jgi:thymidine kinase